MAGYDEAWVNEAETKDLMCAICLCVARDIVQHSCGASFCEACFKQNQAAGRPCANCRGPADAAAANRDRLTVQNLTIRCPNSCGATFRLGDKEKHLTDKCPALATTTTATINRFAYVWINEYWEAPRFRISGAVTLFRKDVGTAVCDSHCQAKAGTSKLVGGACECCAMDAAGRKGWEYLGAVARGQGGYLSYSLRKRL